MGGPNRRERRRLAEPYPPIALPRQNGLGIMAQHLALRAVDHADEAFGPGLLEFCPQCLVRVMPEIDEEVPEPRVMAEPLMGAGA